MMLELSQAFVVSTISVASIVGLFYYWYSPFGLVAGAAMDRFGRREGNMAAPEAAYTVMKEANPFELSGTATGVVKFLMFKFSAMLAPVVAWVLQHGSGGPGEIQLRHYQRAFALLLVGVTIAIAFTFYLRETGTTSKIAVGELKQTA